MSTWKTIDTAPRDGTLIMVISIEKDMAFEPSFAWWSHTTERFENGEDYDSWPITHWTEAPDGNYVTFMGKRQR